MELDNRKPDYSKSFIKCQFIFPYRLMNVHHTAVADRSSDHPIH